MSLSGFGIPILDGRFQLDGDGTSNPHEKELVVSTNPLEKDYIVKLDHFPK